MGRPPAAFCCLSTTSPGQGRFNFGGDEVGMSRQEETNNEGKAFACFTFHPGWCCHLLGYPLINNRLPFCGERLI